MEFFTTLVRVGSVNLNRRKVRRMTLEEEIMKLDLIASDAFEGGDANEFRQLAEWLKELKKWRALRDSINMLCDVDCEYPQYRERGTMCDACPIGTVKDYFEQIFDGEVNADGDSD